MAAELRTISGDAGLLASGQLSAVELVKGYLERIDKREGEIGAFLALDREKVLAAAAAADSRRASGKALSRFDGVPVGIKDCIVAEGETASCASKILKPVISPFDATAVARLRAMGFIPFGRLNMDEFAMGSSCENSAFHKTANPRDVSRVPGGSSGGSAACVAAGFAPAALGSDTGGSIRQPAAFCGVVGLKPTYGRVSRYGLVAFASSLDQIGPLTNSVEDAGILLDSIAGRDPRDSTSLPAPAGGFAAAAQPRGSLKGVRIGLPKEYLDNPGIAPGVAKTLQDTIAKVRELGAETVEVSLPHTKYAVAVYYIVATAEASANLARFDGMRYGARIDGRDLADTYLKSRGQGFGAEVKRRILLGTYVLSSGYYDAYYLRAQKVRTLIRRDFDEAFKSCDVMMTPVTPDVAFKFGEKADPLQMYLSDIFTIALNLSGNCGISIPAGRDGVTGMPVGVQLLGNSLDEARLLGVASTLMKNL
ncbi:MAG: Asp-tRNA(Asn)/Glu-tRNA(Gln) amidotransferase subunit GatA [Victivallaceae bacterium]|nr:Asp-tRNA(Asn)/Glu-tRNA(Gln) amidotransferase subunit GatA [Victivallaceae bacterium]